MARGNRVILSLLILILTASTGDSMACFVQIDYKISLEFRSQVHAWHGSTGVNGRGIDSEIDDVTAGPCLIFTRESSGVGKRNGPHLSAKDSFQTGADTTE